MSAKFVTWEDAVKWLMKQPDKQALVKDCYYDESIIEAANRYWQSDEWAAIVDLISSKPGQALDLGAGRGIASFALAKQGWQVLAVEPDTSEVVGTGAINLLKNHHHLPISISEQFGEKVDCKNASMDLVFARQVLHHANDLEQLCQELFRVLKPGGQFIAVRDHVINKEADLPRFYDKHPLHNLYGGEFAYTEKEYLDAMRKAGFKVDLVLRSFDSVINFAPFSEKSLQEELRAKLAKIPVLGLFSAILKTKWIFKLTLKLLSQFDNRPGRLFSFVCTKTE